MMRTVEVIMVVIILATAFIVATFYAVLPTPRQISSPSLRQISFTTLQVLDNNKVLTDTVFKDPTDLAWTNLQVALAAILPPNINFNLTVYDMTTAGSALTYTKANTITNAIDGIGTYSESASYLVTSTNVTFAVTPKKISRTLYILNCSDANGWWITGYTSASLALDLRNILSPYFNTTILVQTTTELGRLLNGTKVSGLASETVANAVVLNTFGEAVPIPSSYADSYPQNSYARYCYELGKRTNQYNWTWVSIVGWPLYYVSNTAKFSSSQNSWGIYGMVCVGDPGLRAFLMGLDGQSYASPPGNSQTGSPGVVYFTSSAKYYSNYYGIYPSSYQTSTRALPSSYLQDFNLAVDNTYGYVFQQVDGWIAGATYNHKGSDGKIYGSLTAIGLTRIPDIRITALALLMYYHPILYKSDFTLASGERPTQRLIVLQLSQQGGS